MRDEKLNPLTLFELTGDAQPMTAVTIETLTAQDAIL